MTQDAGPFSVYAFSNPLVAKPHTPIYTMHRHFARRPYNVFEAIIQHYSEPGDIILDPFMGGGVTVVEALRARRKVVGVDINPLSVFITRNEVKPVNLYDVQAAFADVERAVRARLYELYEVRCSHCGGVGITDWAYRSSVIRCPNPSCSDLVTTELHKTVVPGKRRRYVCPSCSQSFEPIDCERMGESLIRIGYTCKDCGSHETRDATFDDQQRVQALEQSLDSRVEEDGLQFPPEAIPDGDRVRDDALYRKGYTHFHTLFTKRNLLANAMLKQAIKSRSFPPEIDESLVFVFSSSLSWTCRMRKDTGHGWEHHAYWIPESFYESNVWLMFRKQFDAGVHSYLKGKQYSMAEIGTYCKFSDDFASITGGPYTCQLLCTSAHELPIPDRSIDVVITDPLFGGNVQYAELTDFWAVWIKENLGLDGLIDNQYEAIQTRNTGFAGEKSLEHYEDMLFRIFSECHRVLKSDGWMVMTFHNRDLDVWMALQRAANRAGFKLPSQEEDANRGMIYQPPIQHYTTTMHQRVTGAMLGDFILSFKKQHHPVSYLAARMLTTAEETAFIGRAADLIRFHGGADDSTLMTGLIPYLNESNLFGKLANVDFRPLFSKNFVRDNEEKKWFTPDMVDPSTAKLKPLDYVQAEQVTEEILYSFLKGRPFVTLDEILSYIYGRLVNSHRPGIQAINVALARLCDEVPLPGSKVRRGFRLKGTRRAGTHIPVPQVGKQKSLFGELVIADSLSHDQIIALLSSYAHKLGFDLHIGNTEQRKNPGFQRISLRVLSGQQLGLPDTVLRTISEIDLIVLKGDTIFAAFEVATTVETANKAINDRYRNLHMATPHLNIRSYVVVRDADFAKAHAQLFTPVNVKDGLSRKTKIVRLSQLTDEGFAKLIQATGPHPYSPST